RAVGDRGVIVVLDANDDGPKLRGPLRLSLRLSRRIGSRGPPHHRPHHDRQEPAAAQPTCLHQFLRGGNPCLEADHTWCPGGATSWHAAKLRLTHVFFPLGFIAVYRQRLFVEHDLDGSLGSAVDAARRAGHPWTEQMSRKMLRNVEKR